MAPFRIPALLKFSLFVALALGLLWSAFQQVDFADVMVQLQQTQWGWIGLSIVLGYLAVISRGMRWNLVLRSMGHGVGIWPATHATSIGYMVNMAIPRAGEVARATALSRKKKVPFNTLFGTIIMERTIDLLMLGGMFLLTLTVASEYIDSLFEVTANTGASAEESSLWPTVALAIIVLVTAAAIPFRKPLLASAIGQKFLAFVMGLWDGFKSVLKLDNPWAFWGHTLFIWSCYFVMIYVCFFAFPFSADLSLDQGLFVMVAASLGIVIPTPGGVGSYHWLVSMAFVVLGHDYASGLAFATVVHASQSLMLILSGAIGMVGLQQIPKTN